jgi:hypothetical protein
MIDNHKYGMWKPWKDEEPIDKPISFNESAIINKASKLLESLSPESRISIINELSNDLLGNYKKAASADATASDKKGDYKRGDKRMSGIVKATKKQFANDEKNVEEARYDSGDYYNARMGREYGMDLPANTTGSSYRELNKGDGTGERGRPQKLKGVSKSLPADVFGRTTGKIPKGKPGTVHSMMRDIDEDELDENCWKGYHKEGNKELFGKTVPNCVKNEAVAEGGAKDRQWSNKDMERLRVATRDFDDIMASDGPEAFKQELIKKRIKTKPMVGPKGVLPEQGVAEEQHSCPHCGGEMVSEELMNEKKDACYYKVKSRYKVWPSAYASGALVKCRKSGADSWGNGGKKNESSILEGIEQVDENLHQWFKEKWVRFGPDGKIRGDCARGDDSEGKPKCLPQSKAQNLGKKGRASAAARKRREDPNPERSGKAINVNTKKKSNESLDEGWKEKLGAAALAGSMALGAGAAHSRVTPDGQGGFTGGLKPSATVTAPSDDKPAAEAPKGFSKEYLQKAADPNRTGRYMISVEKAQELLKQMNEDQLDEKWSQKYKDSINCSNPKGFSQKAHCQGKNK